VRPSRIAGHISAIAHGHEEPTLGHNPLGGIAVLLLLALTTATVWTGGFGGEPMEDVHELVAWTLLAMVALHVLAVIAMSVLERENLVRAMITGKKPAARNSGGADARRPGPLALLVAFIVVVGTGYGILRYDPQAFTLRSAESFEHRNEAGLAARGDTNNRAQSEPGER